jgi:hypothetical protein
VEGDGASDHSAANDYDVGHAGVIRVEAA